ncbi:MAG: bifunctional nuclease family protein [Calditrichaeota bacterium]|nr:bifunctional nuclease family protein [Candidatus Cloacimonadota bacterium]MCB1047049.1 bifunctional nuclease family protein [Calditrichota bacterium]MCB9475095.1 bifunctional nuclease family protein [Candidatus Delongbacteria bacterium]
MLEVEINEVTFNPSSKSYMVILRQKDADRWLPIYIGPGEAQTITFNMRHSQYPRPMTFDLIQTLIEKLGGVVSRVLISQLKDDTFFAEIDLIKPDGEVVTLDTRPSDAIPLALKLRLPIYMNDDVMQAAGHDGYPRMISLEERISHLERELGKAVEAEDYEHAAELRDQIKQFRTLQGGDRSDKA